MVRYSTFIRSSLRLPFLKGFIRNNHTTCQEDNVRKMLKKYANGQVMLEKDEQSGVALITLDNKNKKNAISGSMMCDLRDVIEKLQSWGTGKGIIIRGAEGTFCSGGDLETVKNIQTPEMGYDMSCFMGKSLECLSQLPMISVALVEGAALGGGAEIAISCDFMVMSDKARFGFVQTKMGVITGWGAGTRLVRKFGPTKSLDVLASGRMMDSVECKRLGFAQEIFPQSENLLNITKDWLQQYCKHDIKVIRNLKTMISHANSLQQEEASIMERKLFSELWGGESNLEAMRRNLKH